ncbi:MAG: DUF2066 domain-containing protein [Gammaproteobacteria bacterium]|nr:DUF2066 domain-containing protein [Gammaproteobacteria bacterium]
MHRLFFVLISLLVSQSFAADVTNLYQSQAPVSSQSEEERQNLAPELLQQVILKVVGDRSELDTIDLSPILAQTKQLIQQYKYHRINTISDDLTQPDRLEILLSFNKKKLNQSLIEVGLPIWGNSRPEVIIWSAIEEDSSRTILSADDSELESVKALQQAAQLRGLPILLPVMDLQDQSQVTYTDLSAGFSETVESASQRYGAPVILMMKTTVSDMGLVRTDWHALIDGESELWQSRGDMSMAMSAGIDELTDRLAKRFSQRVTTQYENTLALQITDVNNYSDYARVVKYLASLQYVSDIRLLDLLDDTLNLSLSFSGDLTVFDRTVAIDRVLIEQSPYTPSDVKTYRLSL